MKAQACEAGGGCRAIDNIAPHVLSRARIAKAKETRAERRGGGNQRRVHGAILERAAVVLDGAIGEDGKGQQRRAAVKLASGGAG